MSPSSVKSKQRIRAAQVCKSTMPVKVSVFGAIVCAYFCAYFRDSLDHKKPPVIQDIVERREARGLVLVFLERLESLFCDWFPQYKIYNNIIKHCFQQTFLITRNDAHDFQTLLNRLNFNDWEAISRAYQSDPPRIEEIQ